MPLNALPDYLDEARTLLQDTTTPVRYSDAELIQALDFALMETRRLRPDLFLGDLPGLMALPDVESIPNPLTVIEHQYRVPLVYYMVGHCLMRDDEEGNDQKSMQYRQRFVGMMLALAA